MSQSKASEKPAPKYPELVTLFVCVPEFKPKVITVESTGKTVVTELAAAQSLVWTIRVFKISLYPLLSWYLTM